MRETREGVEIIDLYDLYEEQGWDKLESYEEECKAVQEWCEANEASFYEVPGDQFNLWQAVHIAQAERKRKVVVNSLS